jgi:hypothetical protein
MLRYDRYVRIEEHCGCQQTTWSFWKGYQIDMPCMTRARTSPNAVGWGLECSNGPFPKKTKQFQDVKQICAIHRSADRPFLSICHLPIVLFYEPMRPKPSTPVLPQNLNWCIHIYMENWKTMVWLGLSTSMSFNRRVTTSELNGSWVAVISSSESTAAKTTSQLLLR